MPKHQAVKIQKRRNYAKKATDLICDLFAQQKMNYGFCNFDVFRQSITYKGYGTYPVGDSQGYLYARFFCDDTWKSLEVNAIFKGKDNVFTIPLDKNLLCLVPWELLAYPNKKFAVGLVGYGQNNYKVTTHFAWVDINRSCDEHGSDPQSPTMDLFRRMTALYGEVSALISDAENGKLNGITPHIGENGNWFIGENDTGTPVRGEKGDIGEIGYSGLVPLRHAEYSPSLTIPSNKMTVISPLSGDISITLEDGIEGYDNEWDITVIQNDTAYTVSFPDITWGLGIAPAFLPNSSTVCRLYYIGNRLCGEWVSV